MDNRAECSAHSLLDRMRRRFSRRFIEYSTAALWALLALVIGWWAAERQAALLDAAMRENLLKQAHAIARAIDPALATDLSFTADDAGTAPFEVIKEQLTAYSGIIEARGIYTMKLRDGTLYFGPESYPEGDPMASPPGTAYLDPGKEDFGIFSDGRPYVIGPESDEYGTFVSALAAVRDPDTSRVVMTVGIDVMASDWERKLAAARRPALGFAFAIMLLLAISVVLLRWRRKGPPQRRARWLHLETGLVFFHSMLVVCFVVLWFNHKEKYIRQSRFENLAEAHLGLVERDLRNVRRSLVSMAAFFEASDHINRDEFKTYTATMLRLRGGPVAFAWIPSIVNDALNDFSEGLSAVHENSHGVFEITDGVERLPFEERERHFPVFYIEPVEKFGDLIGWDTAGCEGRSVVLNLLLDNQESYMSIFNDEVSHKSAERGLWVYYPVHGCKLFPDTPENVAAASFGFVAALVYPEKLITRALDIGVGHNSKELDICLLALDGRDAHRLLASSVDATRCKGSEIEKLQNPARIHPVFMLGKPLALIAKPLDVPQSGGVIKAPQLAGGAGVFLTLALVALVAQMRRRESVLEKLVVRRTQELAENEALYRTLFSSMINGCALHEIICDDSGEPCDYIFLQVNPAFEKMTGLKRSELIGHRVRDVLPELDADLIKKYGRVALEGESDHFEYFSRELDRYYAITAYSPREKQFAVIVNDVTARKRATEKKLEYERRMQETQRLESLGVLAGGIAHDFNNILMAILGYADLAQQELSPVSPAMECIVEVEKAARCAGELCKQMLAYSGKGHFVVDRFMLNDIIQEMLHLLKHSISKRAVLNLHLAHQLPLIEGDATQIRQVVMNLVINASDALEEKSGSISVTTGAMQCDKRYLFDTFGLIDLEEGLYLVLEIADTGCGMPQETIERIFDPFYTTKFTGRGLGLAAVLGIVRGHKGALKVYSEVGKGSIFKVLLPAVEETEEERLATAAAVTEKKRENERSGLVLLVDDEETNRALGQRMLKKLGMDVVTACDGIDAIEIYRERGAEICCVVLDLTMPRMNGEETFRKLREIDASARVILTSGYSREELSERLKVKGFKAFLEKPYTSQVLADTIDQTLA